MLFSPSSLVSAFVTESRPCLCWPEQCTDHRDQSRADINRGRVSAFYQGFLFILTVIMTQPGTIHCQGSIMSFLCNVCDYLSNCHDIVCQFLLLNRGRQTERGRETQMFIWRRYLNARDKIRHQHKGKSLKQSDLNAAAVSVML